jgi:hypothetical protein
MIRIENKAGRLIEISPRSPIVDTELEPARGTLFGLIRALNRRVVIALDFSKAKVWPKEHAERLLETMRQDNPMLERSGYYIPADSASVVLQFHRLIRDAKNPVRKAFSQLPELYAYLDEVLEPLERQRLREYFAESLAEDSKKK